MLYVRELSSWIRGFEKRQLPPFLMLSTPLPTGSTTVLDLVVKLD